MKVKSGIRFGTLPGMTKNERKLGRFIRDGEGHPAGGGGDSGGGGNNAGGNNGGGGGDPGSQNNNGNGFDPSSFWNPEPPQGSPQGASSGSAGESGGGSTPKQPEGNNQGSQFAQRLANFKVGDTFSKDVIDKMNEGDFAGVNQAIQSHVQAAVKESVMMNAQILQTVIPQIMQDVQKMVDERFGTRDNQSDLADAFPDAYKDPARRPMIDSIFNQAMKLSKNDRKGAIEMTREMLKHSAKTFASEFDIDTPPRNPGDSVGGSTNWVEALGLTR